MKKLFTILSVLLLSCTAFAQQERQEQLDQEPPMATQAETERSATDTNELIKADPVKDEKLKKQQKEDMKKNRQEVTTPPKRNTTTATANQKRMAKKASTNPEKQ